MTVSVLSRSDNQNDFQVTLRLGITGKDKSNLVKEALKSFAAEAGVENAGALPVDALKDKLSAQLGADLLGRRVSAYVAAKTALPIARELGLDLLFAPESRTQIIECLFDTSYTEYDVLCMCHPHFSLSSYDPVHIYEEPGVVTEEMMQAQLQREMARFASFEVREGALQEGDVALASLMTTANGELEPTLSGESMRIVVSGDLMPQAFVENVVGMSAGEHKDFEFLATDQSNPSAPSVSFQVHIELQEVYHRVIPELTDEFVRTRLSATAKTVEEFRVLVRRHLEKKLQEMGAAEREQLIDKELGSRLQGIIPDYLIERTRDDMLASIQQTATMQGMTLMELISQQGMNTQQFQMQLSMQARESLRQGFALDALYEELQLPLTEEDYQRALAELAPGNEVQARRNFEENGVWFMVEQMAKRLKAHQWAVETAVM